MPNNDSSYNENDQRKDAKKIFKCSGCGTSMSKYDEKCSNCERSNPDYIYR